MFQLREKSQITSSTQKCPQLFESEMLFKAPEGPPATDIPLHGTVTPGHTQATHGSSLAWTVCSLPCEQFLGLVFTFLTLKVLDIAGQLLGRMFLQFRFSSCFLLIQFRFCNLGRKIQKPQCLSSLYLLGDSSFFLSHNW